MSSRPKYTLVPETLQAYRIFGMPTPGILATKLELLSKAFNEEPIALVVFDAFRCSSTILACFAAGLSGAVVMEKGLANSGTPIKIAREIAKRTNRPLILGGELSGNPIPGGIIGNSPIQAIEHRNEIRGALLHFQSTNFAKVFAQATKWAHGRMGGADVYVASLANAASTISVVKVRNYQRVMLVGAGFFECIALEDMILGGLLASEMGATSIEMDDDALAMMACYTALPLSTLESCWTARVLKCLSKGADVTDIIGKSRFPPEFQSEMSNRILKVNFDDDVPMVRDITAP